MMKVFEQIITVSQEDLDDLNHVNNVRYVQWIQEISKKHWEYVAEGNLRQSFIWVVRNHNITYHKAAFLGDSIAVKTYIEDSDGALSTRVVEMHNAVTGDLLLQSKTAWCLLNATSLKPMRISGEISSLFL